MVAVGAVVGVGLVVVALPDIIRYLKMRRM